MADDIRGEAFHGPFKAFVDDVSDPLQSGRIKVKCPEVWGSAVPDIWALPMFGGMAGGGLWNPPKANDVIWVFFENGDPSHPRWANGWWGDGDMPEVFKDSYGQTRGWVSPEGDYIVMGPSGVKVYGRNGAYIEIAGNAITVKSGTVEIKQGGKGAARIGDRCIGTGNHGAPVNSRIVSGSGSVKIGN